MHECTTYCIYNIHDNKGNKFLESVVQSLAVYVASVRVILWLFHLQYADRASKSTTNKTHTSVIHYHMIERGTVNRICRIR